MSSLAAKISACYAAAYANEPFVRLLEGKALPDTKNVVGTNVSKSRGGSTRAPAGSS